MLVWRRQGPNTAWAEALRVRSFSSSLYPWWLGKAAQILLVCVNSSPQKLPKHGMFLL